MPISPLLQLLDEPVAAAREVRLLLWRDDLAHPDLPGNKARKLKHNLAAARQQGHRTLLTFGGAYSNHIAAVATAGRLFGFQTIGLIRGDEPAPGTALNPTLARAVADGMALHYLDRTTYRRRAESEFIAEVLARFGPAYVLPEGGTNALALPGCAELVAEIRQHVGRAKISEHFGQKFRLGPAAVGGAVEVAQGHAIGGGPGQRGVECAARPGLIAPNQANGPEAE